MTHREYPAFDWFAAARQIQEDLRREGHVVYAEALEEAYHTNVVTEAYMIIRHWLHKTLTDEIQMSPVLEDRIRTTLKRMEPLW